MDFLQNAVQQLTGREKELLTRRIANHKQKLYLLKLMEHQEDWDAATLALEVFGTEAKDNLYTLKNRLLDDIVEVKVELNRNIITITQERVSNLRGLVYSRDKVTLIRELKRCEKNALSLELYNELKEIHFCNFLTYRHDEKKAQHFLDKIEDCGRLEKLRLDIETLFYSKLLDTQDLFYFFNDDYYAEAEAQLQRLEQLHQQLNSKASEWFYLSAVLTLRLNSKETLGDPSETKAMLERLENLYSTTFLIYRYPNCQLAIECLQVKFHYLTADRPKVEQTLASMRQRIFQLKGQQMFDCSLFFYTYISVLWGLARHDRESLVVALSEACTDQTMDVKSAKMRAYYLYLVALLEYYKGNAEFASTLLYQSRNDLNNLAGAANWIVIENILFNILIRTQLGDHDGAELEARQLKKALNKYNLATAVPLLSQLPKALRLTQRADNAEFLNQFMADVRQELGLLQLVSI